MKTLFYTFRTTPFKDKIPKAFIFGKLKEDFETFTKIILNEKPDLIMGIAKSKSSKFESKTINQFNQYKLSKSGVDNYHLHILNNDFPTSKNPTTSFCNWTMYKISEFIKNNNLNTKVSFSHIREKDLLLITQHI